jgi:hypothetical protein
MDDRVGTGKAADWAGETGPTDPVTLPADTLARYERFSLYNSPYPAHGRGRAVDLYPSSPVAPSPVAGTIRETRTVRCPPKPYAADRDHLILVDVDPATSGIERPEGGPELVGRILHADPNAGPGVTPGDEVAVGDPLGRTVRSGFFGRWVADHVHLGFRRTGANLHRASGSLPVGVGVGVEALRWDGAGTVVETGPTHIRLDAPAHPDPDPVPVPVPTGDASPAPDAVTWAALASDGGAPLDGALAHYGGGGVLADPDPNPDSDAGVHAGTSASVDSGANAADGSLSLLGTRVGAVDGTGTVSWGDVGVYADGTRATGLSLFASRVDFGAKVVFHEGHDFAVGDAVEVAVRPVPDRIRLD